MDTFRVLVESGQFGAGLTAGLATALGALVWVAAGEVLRRRAVRREPDRPARSDRTDRSRGLPGVVGPAFCLAVLAAMDGTGALPRELAVPGGLWAGIGLLVLAGALAARTRHRAVAGMALALPGGVLLAGAVPGEHPAWALVLVVAGPALAGAATADVDGRLAGSGTTALLFLVSLGGAYATLPDTELARITLGAALPATVLAWPVSLARLGNGGSYGAVGLFLWVAVVEGAGRPGSTVGAAACLGVLLVEPLGRLLARHRPGHAWVARVVPGAGVAILVGAQCTLALYFARVAGFEQLAARATVLALPVALVALCAAVAVGRSGDRPRPG